MMHNNRPIIENRPPQTLMRLSRIGSLHQSRLSFMRQFTRRFARENWHYNRLIFTIDDKGCGHAVYQVDTGKRTYSLIAFAHDLPDEKRSDRVIAEEWDTTYTLFDGTPTPDDIERLSQNVPLQEAGRVTRKELTLSRANRSVRLWDYITDALAEGRELDRVKIKSVGYLMRTTAVYGSGKFGAADRGDIEGREEFAAPFQVEMLTVYLIRTFVRDLINHCATLKNPSAQKLPDDIARSLGIGNSTGLGMAPFIVNHPRLFSHWMKAREDALTRVRSLERVLSDKYQIFYHFFQRMIKLIDEWHSDHTFQQEKLRALKSDVRAMGDFLKETSHLTPYYWNSLFLWGEAHLSEEGQELLASLILEPYSESVDIFEQRMADFTPHFQPIDGSMTVADLKSYIEQKFSWGLCENWDEQSTQARVWYVSQEKLEPRLGERFQDGCEGYEQPLAIARDIAALYKTLQRRENLHKDVAEFLNDHSEHRHSVRRVQNGYDLPYGEIHDNIISSKLIPIDMLRAKLSFFGATKFDPRSDRWLRITMFAGCPYPDEITASTADFWVYPEDTAA